MTPVRFYFLKMKILFIYS
ncbi:hypothetical protein VULLAG_LOCUS5902 [Vulpes lagopus]